MNRGGKKWLGKQHKRLSRAMFCLLKYLGQVKCGRYFIHLELDGEERERERGRKPPTF